MAEKLVINLTFKQSEKWLFDEIKKHSGKGNWVKDVLKEYLLSQKEDKKSTSSINSSEIDDILK